MVVHFVNFLVCNYFVDLEEVVLLENWLADCTAKHRVGRRYTRNLYGCAIPPRSSIAYALESSLMLLP